MCTARTQALSSDAAGRGKHPNSLFSPRMKAALVPSYLESQEECLLLLETP